MTCFIYQEKRATTSSTRMILLSHMFALRRSRGGGALRRSSGGGTDGARECTDRRLGVALVEREEPLDVLPEDVDLEVHSVADLCTELENERKPQNADRKLSHTRSRYSRRATGQSTSFFESYEAQLKQQTRSTRNKRKVNRIVQ